jgi:hypothetical protein
MRKTSSPPVIRKAGSVMSNSPKITFPATENIVTIRNATISDRNATALVVCSSSSLVRPTKIGTFAMGFIMAKKPVNTVNAWSSVLSILCPNSFSATGVDLGLGNTVAVVSAGVVALPG